MIEVVVDERVGLESWSRRDCGKVPDAECLRIDDVNHLRDEQNPADLVDLSSGQSHTRINSSHVSWLACYRVFETFSCFGLSLKQVFYCLRKVYLFGTPRADERKEKTFFVATNPIAVWIEMRYPT